MSEEQLLGAHGFTALAALAGRVDTAQAPDAALRRIVQVCEHWARGLAPDLSLDAFADKVMRLESGAGVQDFRANMYVERQTEPAISEPEHNDESARVAARIAANREAALARKRQREQERLSTQGSTVS